MAAKNARSKYSLGVTMLLDELLGDDTSPIAPRTNAATVVLGDELADDLGDLSSPVVAACARPQAVLSRNVSNEALAGDTLADADLALLELDGTLQVAGALRVQEARLARLRAELEELRHVSEEVGDMCSTAGVDETLGFGRTASDGQTRDDLKNESSSRLERLRAEVVQLQKLDSRGEVWGALPAGAGYAHMTCTREGFATLPAAEALDERAGPSPELTLPVGDAELEAEIEACAEIENLQGELDAANSRLRSELSDLDKLLAECDAVQASWS